MDAQLASHVLTRQWSTQSLYMTGDSPIQLYYEVLGTTSTLDGCIRAGVHVPLSGHVQGRVQPHNSTPSENKKLEQFFRPRSGSTKDMGHVTDAITIQGKRLSRPL